MNWKRALPLSEIAFLTLDIASLSVLDGARPQVERKLNSNCYFNIYHLPRKSHGSPSDRSGIHLGSIVLPPLPPPPPGKMLNARLSASIFQRGFHRCINRGASSVVHHTEQRKEKRKGRIKEQNRLTRLWLSTPVYHFANVEGNISLFESPFNWMSGQWKIWLKKKHTTLYSKCRTKCRIKL